MTVVRVHLGCGLIAPPGWINIDGSWNARLAKHPRLRKVLRTARLVPGPRLEIPWRADIVVHNVRKPLPFSPGSIGALYASHLLEHLHYEDGKRLLKECHRVLAAGGVLRMVVPDLRAIVREYLGEPAFDTVSPELRQLPAADRLNRRLLLREPGAPVGNFFYRIYSTVFDFHSHKWMYDRESLIRRFQDAGFVEVQEMAFRVSRIPDIDQVEDPGRVLGGQGICVEGVKAAGTCGA